MKSIIQNNPTTFQTEDMQMFHDLEGIFEIDNSKLSIKDNTIYMNNCKIQFHKQHGIGGSFWLSSIALILFLDQHQEQFTNKTVLELGAGCALPSAYIAKHAKSVTASDLQPEIAQDTFELNNLSCPAIYLNWTESVPQNTKYDIIIAADCIYRTTHSYFVNAIKNNLASNGKFFICNADRDHLDDALYALQENWPDMQIETHDIIYNSKYTCQITVCSLGF